MAPLAAARVLEQFFLEARSRLLDIAAILDRLERGEQADKVMGDPRIEKIRQALAVLLERGDGRAERIQQLFSLEYDPNWKRPQPR